MDVFWTILAFFLVFSAGFICGSLTGTRKESGHTLKTGFNPLPGARNYAQKKAERPDVSTAVRFSSPTVQAEKAFYATKSKSGEGPE